MSSDFKGYTCPNVKILTDTVEYDIQPDKVECRLTIKWNPSNKYGVLASFAIDYLNMQYAVHTQYKMREELLATIPEPVKRASCDSYVYCPEDYVYIGTARLKDGDTSDVEIAKDIAYKKAYRQMTSFYFQCFDNLMHRYAAYCTDVIGAQRGQFKRRATEADEEARKAAGVTNK